MDGPVHLTEPMAEPEPVAGCGVCAALAAKRTWARGYRDLSRVADCNVALRLHPHEDSWVLGDDLEMFAPPRCGADETTVPAATPLDR